MKTFYRLYGILSFTRCILPSITFLFLFMLFTAGAYAQAMNAYAQVTGISTTGGKSKLTLGNINQTKHTFAIGEDVIVIQMQDNVIGSNTSNNSSFGQLSTIASAGLYEVGTISAVTGTSMTLTTTLSNTFNTSSSHSSVQVVSFAKVASYTTTANITPTINWDGTQGIGGVIAIQVTGTLTLKHSIIADGAGFAGGAISADYESACEPTVYRSSSSNYAGKGEGIYLSANSNYTYGRAPILTGGGGGSDDNGGGAGGGNYSAGGDGGPGWTCASNPSGGMGGISLSSYLTVGTRVFLGGGGGGGQGNNDHQTAGGNGGGIIIIKAGTLTTDCSLNPSPIVISANGNNSASTANGGNDGAGGAGAAGTILFQVTTYSVPSSCKLSTQANGGNGGDVTDAGAHGGGGGGGQGALIFTGGNPLPNITYSTTPGTGGLNSSSAGATRASNGGGSANAGVIANGGVVLPVHVLNFGAENKNNQVIVRWSGDNDADLTYNVQHSTDDIHFTTIGTVKGTSGAVTANYTFTDYNATTGRNYYRLEMVGALGTNNNYSEIASVNLSALQSIPVAYPNPAHNYFNLRSNNLNNNSNYTVTVTDLTGKIIAVSSHKPAGGVITVTLNNPLKPGLYMYKLSGTDTEQTGKLMIQ